MKSILFRHILLLLLPHHQVHLRFLHFRLLLLLHLLKHGQVCINLPYGDVHKVMHFQIKLIAKVLQLHGDGNTKIEEISIARRESEIQN
jgi:hypothetical protein